MFFCARSQENNHYVLSLKTGVGKVLKAYTNMPETYPSVFTSYEFSKRGNGVSKWQQQLNYPEYGVEMLFGALNNKFLGNVIGLQPFLKWHLTDKTSPLKLSFTAGLGFSYFTNPYHSAENPKNLLIGSHITNYTRGEFEVSYQYKHFRFLVSAGVFHFSNGHVKLPNIGANVVQSKLGIAYLPFETMEYLESENIYPEKWQYEMGFLFGFHAYGASAKPHGGPIYPVYSLKQSIGKNLSPVYRISFGLIAGHYRSFYRFIENELENKRNPLLNSMYMTVFFGQEMCMGHIALSGELGLDIFKPFLRKYNDIFNPEDGFSTFIKQWNSNRLGLKYYFKNTNQSGWNASVGMFIKANFGQADFVECAVNFRF